MKKILSALTLVLGLGLTSAQQTAPATSSSKATPNVHKTTELKKETKTTDVKESKSTGVKLKKDGTPDKRYKANKKLKKDGTPDKRYKQNK